MINRDGANQPGDGSNAVGHTHQDTGVPGRNIQVVHVVSGDGEPAEGDTQREGRHGTHLEKCSFS